MKFVKLTGTRPIRTSTLVLCASAILAAPGAFAQQPRAGAFEMVVFEESAQGRRLIAGDFEQATTLDETGRREAFDILNNHCVALTLAKDFSAAEVACDRAVGEFTSVSVSGAVRPNGSRSAPSTRLGKAMAVTNRGVLRALLGDRSGASEDFNEALKLTSRVKAAAANLKKLEAMNSIAAAN